MSTDNKKFPVIGSQIPAPKGPTTVGSFRPSTTSVAAPAFAGGEAVAAPATNPVFTGAGEPRDRRKHVFSPEMGAALAAIMSVTGGLSNAEFKTVMAMAASTRGSRVVPAGMPLAMPTAGVTPAGKGPAPAKAGKEAKASWKQNPRWKAWEEEHKLLVSNLKAAPETDKSRLLTVLHSKEATAKTLKHELQGKSL